MPNSRHTDQAMDLMELLGSRIHQVSYMPTDAGIVIELTATMTEENIQIMNKTSDGFQEFKMQAAGSTVKLRALLTDIEVIKP